MTEPTIRRFHRTSSMQTGAAWVGGASCSSAACTHDPVGGASGHVSTLFDE
jgi:hypothetical protein